MDKRSVPFQSFDLNNQMVIILVKEISAKEVWMVVSEHLPKVKLATDFPTESYQEDNTIKVH